MEYQVVTEEAKLFGISKLEEKVHELIRTGWKPIGGMNSDGRHYFQAMIKE